MKSLFYFLAIFCCTQAFGNSVHLLVPTFKGELKIVPVGVRVQKVEIVVENKFCNYFGVKFGCETGPMDQDAKAVYFKFQKNSNLITFTLRRSLSLISLKPLKRFSYCKVYLAVKGEDEEGKVFSGEVEILKQPSSDLCASSEYVKEAILEKFKVPQDVFLY